MSSRTGTPSGKCPASVLAPGSPDTTPLSFHRCPPGSTPSPDSPKPFWPSLQRVWPSSLACSQGSDCPGSSQAILSRNQGRPTQPPAQQGGHTLTICPASEAARGRGTQEMPPGLASSGSLHNSIYYETLYIPAGHLSSQIALWAPPLKARVSPRKQQHRQMQ